MFSKNIKKSFKQFKFKLIVPDIIFIIIGAILLIAFGSFTGLNALPPAELFDQLEGNLTGFFISLSLLIIIAFIIGARLKAFKLMMILNSVNGIDKGIVESYKESYKYFWRVIGLKVISFITLLIGFCLAIILYLVFQKLNEFLALVLGVAVIFAVGLSLFFREAALFRDNLLPAYAIKSSFRVFSKNKFWVLFVALFILLINLVWGLTNNYIPSSKTPTSSIMTLVYILIVFLVSAWSHLFIFNSYHILKKEVPLKLIKTTKKTRTVKRKVKRKKKRKSRR